MRVFVTGGTGLLGNNLIPSLLSQGHEVLALVRSLGKARRHIAGEATLIKGDVTDPAGFSAQLAGVDAVIHAAACYGEFYRENRSETTLRDTNVEGTLKLLQACDAHAVRRVIYVSSAGVLENRSGAATDESAPYASKNDGAYFASKIEAERTAIAFSRAHTELELVVLLPTVMIGPGDIGPTPIGTLMKRLVHGEMKIVLPGALNVADARDVAKAAVAALERGVSGKRYLLGGQRHSVGDIFATMARVSGQSAPTRAPPLAALNLVLGILSVVAKLRGVRPQVRPRDLARMQRDFSFSSRAAREDLGVSYRPLEQTLADTARWFLTEANDPT